MSTFHTNLSVRDIENQLNAVISYAVGQSPDLDREKELLISRVKEAILNIIGEKEIELPAKSSYQRVKKEGYLLKEKECLERLNKFFE